MAAAPAGPRHAEPGLSQPASGGSDRRALHASPLVSPPSTAAPASTSVLKTTGTMHRTVLHHAATVKQAPEVGQRQVLWEVSAAAAGACNEQWLQQADSAAQCWPHGFVGQAGRAQPGTRKARMQLALLQHAPSLPRRRQTTAGGGAVAAPHPRRHCLPPCPPPLDHYHYFRPWGWLVRRCRPFRRGRAACASLRGGGGRRACDKAPIILTESQGWLAGSNACQAGKTRWCKTPPLCPDSPQASATCDRKGSWQQFHSPIPRGPGSPPHAARQASFTGRLQSRQGLGQALLHHLPL